MKGVLHHLVSRLPSNLYQIYARAPTVTVGCFLFIFYLKKNEEEVIYMCLCRRNSTLVHSLDSW